MKLVVRADASPEIGLGHLMRCLALAQAWRDRGGEAVFRVSRETLPLAGRLSGEGCELSVAAAAPGTAGDAAATAALARRLDAPWVVVDGYRFGARFESGLSRQGLRVLALDDDARGAPHAADAVLDPGFAPPELYAGGSGDPPHLLLGPRYALLRREFGAWRGWQRPIPERADKLLVTLGGGDSGEILPRIFAGIARLGRPELSVRVLVGPADPRQVEIRRLLERHRLRAELVRGAEDMAEHLAWADAAVAAAGGTAWELAFLGLPAALVVLADNQAAIAAGLAERACAVSLGRAVALEPCRLAETLARILDDAGERRRMSRSGRALVDGEGARRAVAYLLGDGVSSGGDASPGAGQ